MRLLVLATIAFLLANAVRAGPLPQWPQASSDLKPDPGITFGVLPNGLRYAIQPNKTPPGQVSLRLMILAGSAQEQPGEAGVAHLIEHMAFRGTRHIPDGEAMKMLARLGLRPGADTNAGTGPLATTYMFDLSRNDVGSLDAGFLLLRDIAGEILFTSAELAAERPVVLAEERLRATPRQRSAETVARFRLGDHPAGRRPIGDPDVIRTVTPERLHAFYDAYYRPERAVLVVVGDVDAAALEARIKATFTDWTGRGEAGGDPAPLAGDPGGASLEVAAIPGLDRSSLFFLWPRAYEAPDPTRHAVREAFLDDVAVSLLQRRFGEVTNTPDAPFGFWGGSTYRAARVATGGLFEADVVRDAPAAARLALTTVRQFAELGVTQTEVDQIAEVRRNLLKSQLPSASTRPTRRLAGALLESALSDQVVLSPQDAAALNDEWLVGLKASDINSRLRRLFVMPPPHVAYLTASAPPGTLPALRKALAEAAATPPRPYAFAAPKRWPYERFGPTGRVAERRDVVDLGVTFIRFENGLRLTIKPTDFAQGQVMARLAFGHGQLDGPRDHLAASDLAMPLLMSGGLADLNQMELGMSLRGRGAFAGVFQEEDAFAIGTGPLPAPSAELALQLQLMAAYVVHPGWRADRWPTFLALLRDDEAGARSSPGAVFAREAPLLLHSGDMRWARATPEAAKAWTPAAARAFLEPMLAKAPLELTIVGDVTVDRAIAAAATTFGALPSRPDAPEPAGLRDVRMPPPTPVPLVRLHTGRADQAMIDISWPATDKYSDLKGYAAATLLADILRDRATERLRQQQGRAYGVNADAHFSPALPGYGRMAVSVILRPEDVNAAYQAIDEIAADLAGGPPTADEFSRVQRPRVEAMKRDLRENGAWIALLAQAQADSRRLDYLRNGIANLASVTPVDIQAAARRWLSKEKSWRLTILPGG